MEDSTIWWEFDNESLWEVGEFDMEHNIILEELGCFGVCGDREGGGKSRESEGEVL